MAQRNIAGGQPHATERPALKPVVTRYMAIRRQDKKALKIAEENKRSRGRTSLISKSNLG
jgi:hypothetical protein